jgi:1,2-diacylglycerol 3-alpha-glucosyltransferase
MKILFVSDTYYPHVNGVYYFVQRLATQLQEKGYQVAVIAPSENMHASYKSIDGIDVYGIPSFPVLVYPDFRVPVPFSLRARIEQILRIFNPDIIHIQSHFILAKAVVKANKEFEIPVIGTNHFMAENLTIFLRSEKWKKRLARFLWKDFSKVFNKTELVTTPTKMAADLIRPKLNVEVLAISNGIEFNKFNPDGDIEAIREKYSIPDKPVLLYVGRLDPEKHIEEALQAFALVVKRIDIHFVIVGKGVKKNTLEQIAKDLGITENVTFTGFVLDEDLPYFYKLSRCFITASIAELQSIATMEAMASGLPVITANAGALSELVHNDVNGYLFEPGDIDAIRERVYDVFSNSSCAQKMRQKSLENIHKHDIHKTVEAFERIYRLHCRKGVINMNLRLKSVIAQSSFVNDMKHQ